MGTDSTSETEPGFRYFLHACRRDPRSGLERCSELIATDGERVRTLRGRGAFLTFEEVEEARTAQQVVDTIEREWEPASALLGYRAMADKSNVAIVRQDGPGGGRWVVFPCGGRSFPSEMPTRPADVEADGWRVHLVAGAHVGWRRGEPVLRGALEVRSWGDTALVRQTDFLEKLDTVELRATVEKRGSPEEIEIAPRSERVVRPRRTSDVRADFEIPVEQIVYRHFRDNPSFCAWFVLKYSPDLFEIPETWRRYWMSVEVDET